MASLYCDPRVSKKALNKLLSYFKNGREELHTFSLYDNDVCMVSLAPAPYNLTDKREIYSLSKSFCSTAIGMLVDDGKLSLDDRIVDLFPDKCPEIISDNLAQMKVRHVLSMNTGHKACVMPKTSFEEDAVRAFLSRPVEFAPGTHFTYNTGATCLLSCIVEKISGESLLDFLTERLFTPLGISDVRWNSVNSGPNEGGCGAHVSNEDIAKLGKLYIHNGVYNGKRLLSEKWVKEASSPISDNSCNGSPDWCSGYGFQFWVNSREGYRGDGACGQLCVILPKRNMVIAVQAELNSMQGEIDVIMKFVEHIYDKDSETEVHLPEYSAIGGKYRSTGLENIVWKFDENPMGWTSVRFIHDDKDDTMHTIISDGRNQYNICSGNGEWSESTVIARRFKPKLVGLMSADKEEICRFVSSYTVKRNKIHLALRYTNCPQKIFINIEKDKDGVLHFDMSPSGFFYEGSSALTAKRA